MSRLRWWSVVVLAVIVVGAAMPSFFQPDPTRRIAALEAKVEELANTLRRGKPAAHMRDLRDGELFDAADGQVPVYNASTGKWRPGSAGGASFVAVARTTALTVPSGGTGTIVGMTTVMGRSGATDTTLLANGRLRIDTAGVYIGAGHITFDGSVTSGGTRRAQLEWWDGTGVIPNDAVPYHQTPPIVGSENFVPVSILSYLPAGEEVYIKATHDAASSIDLLADTAYNFFTLARIG